MAVLSLALLFAVLLCTPEDAQVGPQGFNNISWMTLPNQGTGWSEDGQSIVILDEGAVQNLSQALNDGTMADYVKTVPTD